jgi:hypothetical protein
VTNKTVEAMQREYELFMNDLAAQFEVTQTVMQLVVVNLLEKSPDPVLGLERLKEAVENQYSGPAAPGQDPQDIERKRQFLLHHIAKFFAPMEETLRMASTKPGQATQ